MLLSLVNTKLNVMAVGQDAVTINNLFNYSLNLFSNKSCTCIKHNPYLNELFVSYKIDNCGLNYNQAGSLILAGNQGVCYLNNILNYNKKELQSLKETFESKKIMTQKRLRNIQGFDDQSQFSVDHSINCAVWAYYDSSYNAKDKNINDTYLLLNPLIE